MLSSRRRFLLVFTSTIASLALPVKGLAQGLLAQAGKVAASRLTLATLIPVVYSAIVRAQPANTFWRNDKLNRLEAEGRLIRVVFGPEYSENGKTYKIEQVNIPVAYTKNDEKVNPTEANKIALAKSLCENAIDAHDDFLAKKIPDNVQKVVVSKNYCRERGEIYKIAGTVEIYHFLVFTAVVVIGSDGEQVILSDKRLRSDAHLS